MRDTSVLSCRPLAMLKSERLFHPSHLFLTNLIASKFGVAVIYKATHIGAYTTILAIHIANDS